MATVAWLKRCALAAALACTPATSSITATGRMKSSISCRRKIPKFTDFNIFVTNPPFGKGGRLATAFIAAGLRRLPIGGTLALLLPCDFDSGKTRSRFFGDCPDFVGKIVLRRRVKWFEHPDPDKAAITPKENSAWFLWNRSPIRVRRPPVILYAPADDAAAAENVIPWRPAKHAPSEEGLLL